MTVPEILVPAKLSLIFSAHFLVSCAENEHESCTTVVRVRYKYEYDTQRTEQYCAVLLGCSTALEQQQAAWYYFIPWYLVS